MNLFRFITSVYKQDEFVVCTSLSEKQVIKVVAPMVEDRTTMYNLEDYVDAIKSTYPKAIVIAEWEADIINF